MHSRSREALVPAYDPLAPNETDGILPAGTRVSLVLGDASKSAAGKRVVTGVVCGFAYRGIAVDVELSEIHTWIYSGAPTSIEILPPGVRFIFRVGTTGTKEGALGLLRDSAAGGRSSVPAIQVKFRACWSCQAAVGLGDVYCGGCGCRVGIGDHEGRCFNRPSPGGCLACWAPEPGTGNFCRHCGIQQDVNELFLGYIGSRAQLQLRSGRRRMGGLSGRIVTLRVERLSPDWGPQLVVGLDGICMEARGKGATPVDPSFIARFAVRVSDGDFLEAARLLASGAPTDAAEPRLRCSACAQNGVLAPRVLSAPYCTVCGNRGRLLEDSLYLKNGVRGLLKHRCGGLYVPDREHYCGRCGESLANYTPPTDRFAKLG